MAMFSILRAVYSKVVDLEYLVFYREGSIDSLREDIISSLRSILSLLNEL